MIFVSYRIAICHTGLLILHNQEIAPMSPLLHGYIVNGVDLSTSITEIIFFIATNFGGKKKRDKKRPRYLSSDSECETDRGSNSKRQRLEYSSDEEKTVETPARFKKCFKLKIHNESSSSVERNKPVSW